MKPRSAFNAVRANRVSRVIAISITSVTAVVLFGLALSRPELHLLELRFNPFALTSAASAALMLVLLVFFAHKPAQTEERIWLTVYIVNLFVFALGEMLQRLSSTPYGAIFWDNVSVIGIGVPAALYLFTLAYTNPSDRRFGGTIATLLIGGGVLGFFYDFTDVIFKNDPSSLKLLPWGYDFGTPNAGIIGVLLFFYGLLGLALWRLISFRRHTTNPVLRRQSFVFIIGMIFPTVLAVITDVIFPTIGVPTPKLGVTLEAIAACILIYGVRRYQLLTISPTLFSQTILGIMQEAVVATDDHYNIVYQNPRAELLLGVSTASGRGMSLLKVLDPEAVPAFREAFAAPQADVVGLDHIDVVPAHGAAVPIRLTGSRLRIGELRTWVMILTDITAELHTRRTIEHEVKVRTHELHEARAYLVSSINSLEQGFVLVNGAAQVELLNDCAARLCQVPREQSAGRAVADVLQPLDWDIDAGKVIGRVLTTQRARHLAVAAGSGSFYEVYVTPVLSDDKTLGATIVIQDVTEQRILDRSKDEFFSIASHELRTPLTAIRGNMSMAQDYFAEALKDPTLHDLIDDTHAASVRLIEIVNDFLDSSRLEQGKMVFNLTAVSVAPLVAAVVSDLKILIQQQQNTVVLDPTLDRLPPVLADAARLRQIVYNLLSNATKYSERATITVSSRVAGNKLQLRISDTGKGMTPEQQKLLFHKFQQASESILTRDDTKGTGLGLYIAKLLATNMHGDVVLEHTEVSKGSTFMVSLPLARHAAGASTTDQGTVAAA